MLTLYICQKIISITISHRRRFRGGGSGGDRPSPPQIKKVGQPCPLQYLRYLCNFVKVRPHTFERNEYILLSKANYASVVRKISTTDEEVLEKAITSPPARENLDGGGGGTSKLKMAIYPASLVKISTTEEGVLQTTIYPPARLAVFRLQCRSPSKFQDGGGRKWSFYPQYLRFMC